jgi:hypothetical protein
MTMDGYRVAYWVHMQIHQSLHTGLEFHHYTKPESEQLPQMNEANSLAF